MKCDAIVDGAFNATDLFDLYGLDINLERKGHGEYTYDTSPIYVDITRMYHNSAEDNVIFIRDSRNFYFESDNLGTVVCCEVILRYLGVVASQDRIIAV